MKNKSGHERVLLISNSTLYGSGYLDHAEGEIRSFLRGVRSVLFVPYALYDRDAYAAMAQERFERMGYGRGAARGRLSGLEGKEDRVKASGE